MASQGLVNLAKKAAKAHARAAAANKAWAERFEAEYGHGDISDALVEAIDYCTGDVSVLTAKFIDDNSRAEQ